MAVFEWSPTGGMVHLHYILWKDRALRFDLQAAELFDKAKALRRAGLASGGQLPVVDVKHVVDYFEQYINEWNPNKTAEGRDGRDVATGLRQEQEPHTAALSLEEIQHLLRREDVQQCFDYYQRVVQTQHLRNFHWPDPFGHPNPSQPCAQLVKGTVNLYRCSNDYPRRLVCQSDEQNVAQDQSISAAIFI